MQISVSDAKAQLTDLLRRAEAGDKIVLTRHGQPVARLVPIKAVRERQSRRDVIEAMRMACLNGRDRGGADCRGEDRYRKRFVVNWAS